MCQRINTMGVWSSQEPNYYMNILEVLEVKPALISFPKAKKSNSIHCETVIKTALTYLLKLGEEGIKNGKIIELYKKIWD